MALDDADLRVRLEGGAELLEATRLRYRALVGALTGFGWKDKLRRNRAVAHEVARVQAQVDEVLGHAQRRAAAEGWPAASAVVACVREVAALRDELRLVVARRLGDAADARAPLGAQLVLLEEKVLYAPRLVLPGQRWALARELLTPALAPEVGRALDFALVLQRHFSRPIDAAHTLPFSLLEWDDVMALWPRGDLAIETALKRLDRVDRTGGLRRAVERKARHVPGAANAPGVQQLGHAVFWRQTAVARLDAVLAARLAPAAARPHERFGVLRYLLRRERDAGAQLTDEGLPPPRAALLELAHELTGLPQERAGTIRGWEGLLARAGLADAAAKDPDWAKVREGLEALVRVVWRPTRSLPPVYRSLEQPPPARPSQPVLPPTLQGLLAALRERSDVLPVKPKRR